MYGSNVLIRSKVFQQISTYLICLLFLHTLKMLFRTGLKTNLRTRSAGQIFHFVNGVQFFVIRIVRIHSQFRNRISPYTHYRYFKTRRDVHESRIITQEHFSLSNDISRLQQRIGPNGRNDFLFRKSLPGFLMRKVIR